MKIAFVSLIAYDFLFKYDLLHKKKDIFFNQNNPDYFDAEFLANYSDPVHKWCSMLQMNGIDIEFWYLASLSTKVKVFKHKYGHRLRRIPAFNLRNYFSRYFDCDISFELLKELKRQNITHILALSHLGSELLPIDMFDILVIFCRRNNIKICTIYGGGSINNYMWAKRKIKSMFLKKTDSLFCQNKSELNIMINEYNFPRAKVYYFNNPLDLDNFYPIPKDACAKFLNFDTENKYLLYVGRFSLPKGIHHLINIFPKLIAKEPKLRLLIVGRGIYDDVLKKLIHESGYENAIKMFDYVDNDKLKYYYNLAEAVILPSYLEGTPNVLMEAIACNAVCIATNVGGIPDLLSDGVGIMVAPKDEESLHDAIVNILQKKFEINQKKRKELLEEIDLKKKGAELKKILFTLDK